MIMGKQRQIQNPVKHLTWSVLRKQLTVFPQKALS